MRCHLATQLSEGCITAMALESDMWFRMILVSRLCKYSFLPEHMSSSNAVCMSLLFIISILLFPSYAFFSSCVGFRPGKRSLAGDETLLSPSTTIPFGHMFRSVAVCCITHRNAGWCSP